MVYTLLPATEADAHELAPILRAQDHAEVIALGVEPAEALLESVRHAREAWTARADGRIICMAGLNPTSLIGQTAVPWLLGSDLVPQHGPHFLRESRRLVALWLQQYAVLRNVVDDHYTQAHRWLRWLGFTVGEPMPIAKGMFRPFAIERAGS
jgi:hypothetical protein